VAKVVNEMHQENQNINVKRINNKEKIASLSQQTLTLYEYSILLYDFSISKTCVIIVENLDIDKVLASSQFSAMYPF
jgi:hypothetical protein